MTKILVFAVGGLLLLAMGVLDRLVAPGAGARAGVIRPGWVTTGVVFAGGLALGGFGLYAAAVSNGGGIAAGVGSVALLFGLACGTSLLPLYDIAWDETGIEGPSSLWFPPLGPRRVRLDWHQIEGFGSVMGGPCLRAGPGRLCWNTIYPRQDALAAALDYYRPDLSARAREALG